MWKEGINKYGKGKDAAEGRERGRMWRKSGEESDHRDKESERKQRWLMYSEVGEVVVSVRVCVCVCFVCKAQ